MKSFKLMTVSLLLLTLGSCNSEKEHDNISESVETAEPPKDTVAATVNDTTKFKFDFAIANIPSPATSVQELSNWNVPYDNSLLNNTKKAATYTTEYQKGINLGVYNIDMAYAMVNEKGHDVMQYMKNVMQMSDALGLRGAVNTMVGKRAEANLSNRDSLYKILDEIFIKSDSYLRTNERVYTAATVFAGSWLENLYLTCRISEKAQDQHKAEGRKHLWEQRFHLGNLINLLKDYKDKKETADLIADLQPIHKEITDVKQPTDLTDSKYNSISSKIIALREKQTR
jgi:hypothetical protein